jgi:hypothetical protein
MWVDNPDIDQIFKTAQKKQLLFIRNTQTHCGEKNQEFLHVKADSS